jgi:hypothetical protein
MNFSRSKDESILVFYENIRGQVEADMRAAESNPCCATARIGMIE